MPIFFVYIGHIAGEINAAQVIGFTNSAFVKVPRIEFEMEMNTLIGAEHCGVATIVLILA